jgi:hypothetical protein
MTMGIWLLYDFRSVDLRYVLSANQQLRPGSFCRYVDDDVELAKDEVKRARCTKNPLNAPNLRLRLGETELSRIFKEDLIQVTIYDPMTDKQVEACRGLGKARHLAAYYHAQTQILYRMQSHDQNHYDP